ncbi:MAG: hypothetical protein R3D98_15265 [Candidatus Krumholzibacteriia bacterium]
MRHLSLPLHVRRRAAWPLVPAALLLLAGVAAAADTWQQHRLDRTVGLATMTELNVPTSPAFTLLGVNPAQVARPGFAHDLNLDLIVKDDRLVSDLAVDIQPVWMLAFAGTSVAEYQRMGWLRHTLSTLSLSLATSQRDSISSLAYGLRLTLYRQTDPMLDQAYVDGIARLLDLAPPERDLELQMGALEADLELLEDELRDADDPAAIVDLRREIDQRRQTLATLTAVMVQLDARTAEFLHQYETAYRARHWNDAVLDAGCGQILNYDNTEVRELRFTENGLGVWLNGAVGIGPDLQATALWKYLEFDRGIERFAGLNLRYGDADMTGFLEILWNGSDARQLGFGGELRVNGTAAVEAGLHATLDDSFELKQLTPEVKVNLSLLKKLL